MIISEISLRSHLELCMRGRLMYPLKYVVHYLKNPKLLDNTWTSGDNARTSSFFVDERWWHVVRVIRQLFHTCTDRWKVMNNNEFQSNQNGIKLRVFCVSCVRKTKCIVHQDHAYPAVCKIWSGKSHISLWSHASMKSSYKKIDIYFPKFGFEMAM